MKVLISPMQNNAVVDISATGFEVAEPLFWVDAAEGVRPGTHRYVGGAFVEIPQRVVNVQPLSTEGTTVL
jgi:hypothetical protein